MKKTTLFCLLATILFAVGGMSFATDIGTDVSHKTTMTIPTIENFVDANMVAAVCTTDVVQPTSATISIPKKNITATAFKPAASTECPLPYGNTVSIRQSNYIYSYKTKRPSGEHPNNLISASIGKIRVTVATNSKRCSYIRQNC